VTLDKRSHTLVVCIGNELVADDAVGHEIFSRLQALDLPEGTRLEYAGVGGIALLDSLTGRERTMIVVDAVQFGAPAGTIHCLPWEEVPSCDNSAISAHGIGLKETINVGKLLYPERLPDKITLVGIEGRCFNQMKEFMTPATAQAIDKAVAVCIDLIAQHQ
jgi:hydrogenase maturation protease